MATKHFLESKTVTKIDKDTGEVFETEVKKLIKVNMGKQEEFYMTYCKYLAPLYELTYADDLKLIVKLCEWGVYDKGTVSLTTSRRAEITEKLGIHASNISKSLKRLLEKKLITGDRGEYQLNPVIFWKGDRAIRKELLRKGGLEVMFNFHVEDDKA